MLIREYIRALIKGTERYPIDMSLSPQDFPYTCNGPRITEATDTGVNLCRNVCWVTLPSEETLLSLKACNLVQRHKRLILSPTPRNLLRGSDHCPGLLTRAVIAGSGGFTLKNSGTVTRYPLFVESPDDISKMLGGKKE